MAGSYNLRRSVRHDLYYCESFSDESPDSKPIPKRKLNKNLIKGSVKPSDDFTKNFVKDFRKGIQNIESNDSTVLSNENPTTGTFKMILKKADNDKTWVIQNPRKNKEEDSFDKESNFEISDCASSTKESGSTELYDSDQSLQSKSSEDEVQKIREGNVTNYISSRASWNMVNKYNASAEYYCNPEEYFSLSSEKPASSKNSISKLKFDCENRLQYSLHDVNYFSLIHKKGIRNLCLAIESHYKLWIYLMKEGFNILLYGLGSKRTVINNFHKQMIYSHPTIVVNGFFPNLTIKEILDDIITKLLGLDPISNVNECLNIIKKTMFNNPLERIYLLIHNIDGQSLNSNIAQEILSYLSDIPNIYLVASVDHINSPLIWDNVKRLRYNFFWMDASTFLPYDEEIAFRNYCGVTRTASVAVMSLKSVFCSLTSNAKSIYIILAKYQLKNNKKNYEGMSFRELFRQSRDNFLVSSDVTLRAQLTEFIDHNLVKIKRNSEGLEYLSIPLERNLLLKFVEEAEST